MSLTQISTAGVKDDAVTAGKIPANAVGSSELADNAVNTNELVNSAITTVKVADNAITTAKIADSQINNAKIGASAAIAGTKINPDFGSQSIVTTGNVGIGTTSPSGKLNLATGASTTCEFRLTSNNTGSGSGDKGRISVYSSRNDGTAFEAGKIEIDRSSGTEDKAHMIFATNNGSGNAERVRIDSSGNVGIGCTPSNGFLEVKNTSYNGGSTGLLTLEGGSESGVMFKTSSYGNDQHKIATNNNGHMFFRVAAGVRASLTSNGLCFNSDTAAANALDDYEEGTYQVVLSGDNGNYSLSSSADTFSYIKIGRMVTIFGRIKIDAHNDITGTPKISLPFNSMSGSEQSGLGQIAVFWHGWDIPNDGVGPSSLEFAGNSSNAYLLYHRDNVAWAGLNNLRTNLGNLYMALHGSYMTDS